MLPKGAGRRISPTHVTRSHYLCQSTRHGPGSARTPLATQARQPSAARYLRRRATAWRRAAASVPHPSPRTEATAPVCRTVLPPLAPLRYDKSQCRRRRLALLTSASELDHRMSRSRPPLSSCRYDLRVRTCCILILESLHICVQPLVVAIVAVAAILLAKPALSCLDFLSPHALCPLRTDPMH